MRFCDDVRRHCDDLQTPVGMKMANGADTKLAPRRAHKQKGSRYLLPLLNEYTVSKVRLEVNTRGELQPAHVVAVGEAGDLASIAAIDVAVG